ncbi:hypothetical protein ACFXOL_21040 [Streptomyces californicus]|uniref:hypothetical protein n=1 Tax=Streptomyces californicus TaxID=67351 RepID=UPI0036572532
MIDLNGTYTYATPDFPEPSTTVTTRVRTRQRDGMTITTVRGLAPLLLDHINAITDEGDRRHTLELLWGSVIAISDTERPDLGPTPAATRQGGRISTTYTGTRALPAAVVLDLAARIRDQLAAG